jgi:hypothetical protein
MFYRKVTFLYMKTMVAYAFEYFAEQYFEYVHRV